MDHPEAIEIVQTALEEYYGLEPAPDVRQFVRYEESRETLLLKETELGLEVALILPQSSARISRQNLWQPWDINLQLIEGVSHFLYVAERARRELEATELELELQAEVDKFVFFGLEPKAQASGGHAGLHRHLYEGGHYLHPAGTLEGERYRLASRAAARFVARHALHRDRDSARKALWRFYRLGQAEKLSMAEVV